MNIYAFLDRHGITYQRFDHEAVFTCEQAKEVRMEPMPGKDTKNLFLRDDKGTRHFLVTVGHEKKVDLKALKKMLGTHPPSSAAADYGGVKKLSFGSPERLKDHLSVEPGSVTLLGLMNDPEHRVEVFIDKAIWEAPAICCHPLTNTATLSIPHEGIETFLKATGHAWQVIDVPVA